jgi:hypothetical protein
LIHKVFYSEADLSIAPAWGRKNHAHVCEQGSKTAEPKANLSTQCTI